jgi:hypothetical protein
MNNIRLQQPTVQAILVLFHTSGFGFAPVFTFMDNMSILVQLYRKSVLYFARVLFLVNLVKKLILINFLLLLHSNNDDTISQRLFV